MCMLFSNHGHAKGVPKYILFSHGVISFLKMLLVVFHFQITLTIEIQSFLLFFILYIVSIFSKSVKTIPCSYLKQTIPPL
jgi:maltodextrin utilization protein YvdJ